MKWIFRYLKYIVDDGLRYKSSNEGVELVGFMDSDFARNRDKMRSIYAYAFSLCGNCIT